MTIKHGTFKLGLGIDFLEAYSKIPRHVQSRVRKFIDEFRRNPMSSGINYERIKGAKDANLRSVRMNDTYRGIVHKPPRGNLYMLLWVDHHDKAYAWAQNRVCEVHPETGAIQLFEMAHEAAVAAAAEQSGCFDGVRDKDLLKLGVPRALLPLVRDIRDEAGLEVARGHLPSEAYEALFYLLAGESVEGILRERDLDLAAAEVDTQDFEAALGRAESRARFMLVEDDEHLRRMLDAPLEQWRVFLHPSQRKLVEHRWQGPARVLGGAGTGKTVVAMHRARFLAETRYTEPGDRILFTTFTRNLAADIEANLKLICSPAAMKRIEVVNLDRWVYHFLTKQGFQKTLLYDADKQKELWELAMASAPLESELPDGFYREEWEQVVQPQSVDSLRGYLNASRVGRGVRLTRTMRKQVWPVFERYRLALREAGYVEPEDAMREACELLRHRDDILPYRALVVDEGQDMGRQAYRLIRAMIPEKPDHEGDILIVGDAHQRIYRHRVVLGSCGLNIRGRSRRLKVNYRTTEENRNWALALLQGLDIDDLDGGLDSHQGYHSLMHGEAPMVFRADRFEDEVGWIAERVHEFQEEGLALRDLCLVVRTNALLDQYETELQSKGVPTYRVHRSKPEDRAATGLRLATMHRVKGLEFRHVFIAGVCAGTVPYQWVLDQSEDQTIREAAEHRERSLLYVAATRAKQTLLVSCFGKASEYLLALD